MYEIDFSTCTRDDVLIRSIVCHPSALIDALNGAARIHWAAGAELSYDRIAARTAMQAGNDCKGAINRVEAYQDDKTILADMPFGEMIQMFHQAAKLQCVPFATGCEIIERVARQ